MTHTALTPTDDDIELIRQIYIRDLYSLDPPIALSQYNMTMKRNFISDDDLFIIADMVLSGWAPSLSGVYETEYDRRRAAGQTDAAADEAALLLQKDAFLRLIRAEVFERMMLDDGFRRSNTNADQMDRLFTAWRKQITADRTFTNVRTSAHLRGIPVKVF